MVKVTTGGRRKEEVLVGFGNGTNGFGSQKMVKVITGGRRKEEVLVGFGNGTNGFGSHWQWDQ